MTKLKNYMNGSPEECLGSEWVKPFVKKWTKKYNVNTDQYTPEINKISEDLGRAIIKKNSNGVERIPYDVISIIYDDVFSHIQEDETQMEKIVYNILDDWRKITN